MKATAGKKVIKVNEKGFCVWLQPRNFSVWNLLLQTRSLPRFGTTVVFLRCVVSKRGQRVYSCRFLTTKSRSRPRFCSTVVCFWDVFCQRGRQRVLSCRYCQFDIGKLFSIDIKFRLFNFFTRAPKISAETIFKNKRFFHSKIRKYCTT